MLLILLMEHHWLTISSLFCSMYLFLVNEMLQTAKLFARRGGDASNCYKHMNGLTFGEFCVLAADLKRFRTQNTLQRIQSSDDEGPSNGSSHPSSVHQSRIEDLAWEAEQQCKSDYPAPEVFLGGSCNPTTWRADVAIPTLDKLGISFYNPVSEHTGSLATRGQNKMGSSLVWTEVLFLFWGNYFIRKSFFFFC